MSVTSHLARRLRPLLTSLAGLLTVVVGTQVLAAPAASAFTWDNYGTPGSTTPYQAIGTHLSVPCGYGGGSGCFQPGIIVQGPKVRRSPATSGDQIVQVTYVVYRWSNGWYPEITESVSRVIPAGYSSVQFPNRTWLPNTGREKRVGFAVQWFNARGRYVGGQNIHFVHAGDYRCETRFNGCTVYPGYVNIVQPF